MATVISYLTPVVIALALIAGYVFAAPTASAQVGAGIDAGVSLDANTPVVDVDADASATSSVTTTDETDSESTTSVESITILRSSLGAETETAPASAAAVSSDAELSAYASSAMRADERIEAVAFADDSVEVRYGVPGRLLGFIPVTMNARVTVASDGEVAVSYPWYRFLVATDTDADIESELSSRIEATGSFTASQKAALVDEIRAALPSVTASASADAAVR